MAISEEAEELRDRLDEIGELLDEAIQRADEPPVQSKAVKGPLQNAEKEIQIAFEQLGNVISSGGE